MIKNYILQVEDLIEYKIRGIISPSSMYYLAWELNKELNFNLQRLDDHEVAHQKNSSKHILYSDKQWGESEVFLLQNKGLNQWILPQYQMADALLLERNFEGEFLPDLLENIKTPSIQLCLDIDYLSLSDTEKLNIELK